MKTTLKNDLSEVKQRQTRIYEDSDLDDIEAKSASFATAAALAIGILAALTLVCCAWYGVVRLAEWIAS